MLEIIKEIKGKYWLKLMSFDEWDKFEKYKTEAKYIPYQIGFSQFKLETNDKKAISKNENK